MELNAGDAITFAKAATLVLGFSRASKTFGYLGYVGVGLSTYADIQDYKNGDISGERFSYHIASTAIGIAAGVIGSFTGASEVGLGVGGGLYGAEKLYDGTRWYMSQLSRGLANFEYQIKNGWRPH